MRSTLDIEDAVMLSLKDLSAQQHTTLKEIINETLNIGLGRLLPPREKWKCISANLGGGFDYTEAWQRLEDLEAEAVSEKMDLRK